MSRKLGKMAAEVRGASKTSVGRAAQLMKTSIEHELRVVAPSGQLRNVQSAKGEGARLSVSYRVRENRSDSSAFIKAVGPWQIIENDTRPHLIFRKNSRAKGRGARRANRQAILNELFGGRGAYKGGALKLPDGRFRKVVNHPGTTGRKPWAKGVTRGRPVADRELRTAISSALRRGIRA